MTTGVRDLEEMLNLIITPEMKNEMRIAMQAYYNGAYRACIILSVINGMYDLQGKLKELSLVGIKSFVDLDSEIQPKDDDEILMTDATFLDKSYSRNLINFDVKRTLKICLTIRNRCAHPGEHEPSAEEARYVYTSIIDMLLSQRLDLSFKACKAHFLKMLEEPFLFSTSNKDTMEYVVRENIWILAEDAKKEYARFLVDKITQLRAPAIVRKNAESFLITMLSSWTEQNRFCLDEIFPSVWLPAHKVVIIRLLSASFSKYFWFSKERLIFVEEEIITDAVDTNDRSLTLFRAAYDSNILNQSHYEKLIMAFVKSLDYLKVESLLSFVGGDWITEEIESKLVLLANLHYDGRYSGNKLFDTYINIARTLKSTIFASALISLFTEGLVGSYVDFALAVTESVKNLEVEFYKGIPEDILSSYADSIIFAAETLGAKAKDLVIYGFPLIENLCNILSNHIVKASDIELLGILSNRHQYKYFIIFLLKTAEGRKSIEDAVERLRNMNSTEVTDIGNMIIKELQMQDRKRYSSLSLLP